MNSLTSFAEVPVIDATALRASDPAQFAAVAGQLGIAAREVGFFYLRGTGIPSYLFDELLAATKTFFATPLDEKMRCYIGLSDCHRGYVPEGEEVFSTGTPDRKEAFDCGLDLPADDPDHLAGNPLLGPNQWPDQPDFRRAVSEYYGAVLDLGQLLFRAFAVALGEPVELFASQARKAPSQLRLIHYPYDSQAVDSIGIGAHTDYECFTLLWPTAPGLEVFNGAGEWIDVPPLDDAYVVNIGDLLEVWTNGEFVATTHRVRKVQQERYSFPLFFCVDYDTVIEPLPRFVRPGTIARPTVVAGEHLFAQTAQSFRYLKDRLASGELVLPDGALARSTFGQEALLPGEAVL
jgi:isopenicillin N synthase-like dioxygenase